MTTMTAAQVRAQTGLMEQVPDPEVPKRPRPPRTYPAAYKLRILGEYEQLDKAGKGRCYAARACTPRCSRSGASSATGAPWPRCSSVAAGHRPTRVTGSWPGRSKTTRGCATTWSGPAR